jgi:hypothetical protein
MREITADIAAEGAGSHYRNALSCAHSFSFGSQARRARYAPGYAQKSSRPARSPDYSFTGLAQRREIVNFGDPSVRICEQAHRRRRYIRPERILHRERRTPLLVRWYRLITPAWRARHDHRETRTLRFDTRTGDIPKDVLKGARDALIDTVGVALAGTLEPVASSRFAGPMKQPQSLKSLCGGRTSARRQPRLRLRMACAHALDFDDSIPTLRGHPARPWYRLRSPLPRSMAHPALSSRGLRAGTRGCGCSDVRSDRVTICVAGMPPQQ